jgi:hypothetical protein
VAKLDRAAGKWVDIIGGGTTSYHLADGMPGSSIELGAGGLPLVLGVSSTHLLVGKSRDGASGPQVDNLLKLYAFPTMTQSSLAGQAGTAAQWWPPCPDGTALSACALPTPTSNFFTHAHYDGANARWLVAINYEQAVRIMVPGSPLATLTGTPGSTLIHEIHSFAYRDEGPGARFVYYCAHDVSTPGATEEGRIFAFDLVGKGETPLIWPIPSLRCQGRSLIYRANPPRLVFPFRQNGVGGVAEYHLP